MAYETINRGTIGKNKRKEQDSHPDIAGTLNVDGRDYWINGWQKTNQSDGSKFYSLSVKPKEAQSNQSGYGAGGRPDDDEIPFMMEWRA
jgi:hypothetical protein